MYFRHSLGCDTIVYISCTYFKFEKIFHFTSFSGGHIFKGFDTVLALKLDKGRVLGGGVVATTPPH